MARLSRTKVKAGFDKPFEFNQRFEKMNKLASSFNKFASEKTKKEVDFAIRKAAAYASSLLLPSGQQQFDKYHVYISRNFPTTKANKYWNVGYSSGESRKSIISNMFNNNCTKVKIAESGGITLSYVLSPEVQMRLVPEKKARPRAILRGWKGGTHIGVSKLEAWFKSKKVLFSGIKSKNPYKTQAFMTINSWHNKGKPPIMKDRALRITLSDEASEKYSEVLEQEFTKIKSSIANDLINKTFK